MELIVSFASQYPIVASILMVIGILRTINKPLFAFLRTVVEATPTAKDNEILQKVETSKAYQYVSFLLDYVASVKLPVKVVAVPKSESKSDAA